MKVKWKRSLWAIAMGIGIFLGSVRHPEVILEVYAAETPTVSGLQVTADEKGYVAAQCDYQNYDKESGYVMTLYLYQIKENGQASIAAYKIIPYGDAGRCSTELLAAAEGYYQASVGISHDGVLKQVNSERYHHVTISEDKPAAPKPPTSKPPLPKPLTPEQNVTASNDIVKEEQSGEKESCIHIPDYELILSATPQRDSILAYQCTLCGDVFNYLEVPNSAYEAFLQEAVKTIKEAGADEAVICTDRWMSFHRSVLEAISQRPDVTVHIRYRYQGEDCEVTIPAGADVSGLADENGFCGFRYLEQIFDEIPS